MADIEDEDYSGAEDLLQSLAYGIRMFRSGRYGQDTIIGVILEETDDSFLVGMGAGIFQDKNRMIVEELSKGAQYIRLLKSSITLVTFPEKVFELAYLDYLHAESHKIFPELLSMIGEEDETYRVMGSHLDRGSGNEFDYQVSDRKAEISDNLGGLEEDLEKAVEAAVEAAVQVAAADVTKQKYSEMRQEGRLVGNFTAEEVQKKVDEAIKCGCLISNPGTLPN